MQAMAFFDTVAVLVSLLVFFTAGVVAQELEQQVTLWQFGKGRLLPGPLTLPMQPMGTLGDGSATTYLYQVVSDVTVVTTNAAGPTLQAIPKTASRTIVASAPGWVEQFGGDQIACGFVNSGFGECFNGPGHTSLANSGKPTPQVILIATPTSFTTPPSASSSPALPAKSSRGAIAGGIIAGCLLLLVGLAVCLLFRRRRRRQQQEFEDKFGARSYDPQPTGNTNEFNAYNAARNDKPLPFAVFAAGPRLESAVDAWPTRHKRDYSASTQSQSSAGSASHSGVASSSALPTVDTERAQNDLDENGASEAPPAYPATPHLRPREKN